MSLQMLPVPGNGTLILPSPEIRSKALRLLPVAAPGPGTPSAEMSLEQTQSTPFLSSTSTPKVERVSYAPGAIHASAVAEPGLMRQMPPDARLLT